MFEVTCPNLAAGKAHSVYEAAGMFSMYVAASLSNLLIVEMAAKYSSSLAASATLQNNLEMACPYRPFMFVAMC
jgi:hypothetical protein